MSIRLKILESHVYGAATMVIRQMTLLMNITDGVMYMPLIMELSSLIHMIRFPAGMSRLIIRTDMYPIMDI